MERRRQLTGFFARVHWENNAAEFKVLDTEECTEVSFGALLQDVSRYFGVQDGAVALADKDGGIWPLEPMVHSELRALDTTEVWLVEKPFATEANETAMDLCTRTSTRRRSRRRCAAAAARAEAAAAAAAAAGLAARPNPRADAQPPTNARAQATSWPRAVARDAGRALEALAQEGGGGREEGAEIGAVEVRRRPEPDAPQRAHARPADAPPLTAVPPPPRRYFLFVALFFTCINMRRTVANEYQFLSTMSAVFIEENFGDANKKAYMDIATFEEFWEWARGPFTEGLLPAERYDGSEITAAEQRVMYYNKVVGGLRLRQLRIRKGAGCVSDYENIKEKHTPTTGTTAGIERTRIYIDYCYAKFIVGDTDESGGTEDRAAYSVAAPNETLIEMGEQERWGGLDEASELVGAFRWRDAKANRLEGTAQAGQFGAYDGSGFVLDVTNLTTSYIVESFEFLEENTWLDRQTRGIFMSVMLFNANFNTYAVLQFFLELSQAGVMVPTYNFQTVKMDMYYNTRDIPTMAFEGALYLYMFIYICVEFQEIATSSRRRGRSAATSRTFGTCSTGR